MAIPVNYRQATPLEDLGVLIGFGIVVFLPLVIVLAVPVLFGLIAIKGVRHMRQRRSDAAVCICGTPFRNGLCINCGAKAV